MYSIKLQSLLNRMEEEEDELNGGEFRLLNIDIALNNKVVNPQLTWDTTFFLY